MKPGDRVSIETRSGATFGGTLVLHNDQVVQIARGGSLKRDLTIKLHEVSRISRILWASQ